MQKHWPGASKCMPKIRQIIRPYKVRKSSRHLVQHRNAVLAFTGRQEKSNTAIDQRSGNRKKPNPPSISVSSRKIKRNIHHVPFHVNLQTEPKQTSSKAAKGLQHEVNEKGCGRPENMEKLTVTSLPMDPHLPGDNGNPTGNIHVHHGCGRFRRQQHLERRHRNRSYRRKHRRRHNVRLPSVVAQRFITTTSDNKGKRFGNKTATLEMIAILSPLLLIPEKLQGKHIQLKTDSMSCVFGLKDGYMKNDEYASILIRATYLICAYLGSVIHVEHCHRRSTWAACTADNLTRKSTTTFLEEQIVGRFSHLTLPEALTNWLNSPTDDWDLATDLLKHVMNKL